MVELILEKIISKNEAVVGDVIRYTIIAKNTNDIDINNVVVYDLLSPGLLFVAGSVKINSLLDPFKSIVNGINLGKILSGEEKVIEFDVEILNNYINPIENVAKGSFKYENLEGNLRSGDALSNKVTLNVGIANIDVEKTADSEFVVLNDIIEYTVRLKNTGTVDALNVVFKDELSDSVKLLDGSFSIDSSLVNGANIIDGINIGTILVSEEILIKYSVKVIDVKCSKKIRNSAEVEFEYRLKDGSTGKEKSEITSISSNIITVGINNFKQINIDDLIELNNCHSEIDEVTEISTDVKIKKYTIVKTPTIRSTEGQILTKYKAIIYGELELVIEYIGCDVEQSLHSIIHTIKFSTFIVLPETYLLGESLDISTMVEDVYFKILRNKNIFVNATTLIKANVCSF